MRSPKPTRGKTVVAGYNKIRRANDALPASSQLYRDCMRLVRHVAPGSSAKSTALRTMVRTQFQVNANETDEVKLEAMKANAVRGLANYMLYESGAKDAQLSKAMDKFHERAVKDANQDNGGSGGTK